MTEPKKTKIVDVDLAALTRTICCVRVEVPVYMTEDEITSLMWHYMDGTEFDEPDYDFFEQGTHQSVDAEEQESPACFRIVDGEVLLPEIVPDVLDSPEWGNENQCVKNKGGPHEPDWATAHAESDGGEFYVDVNCTHCFRSGCVGRVQLIVENLSW